MIFPPSPTCPGLPTSITFFARPFKETELLMRVQRALEMARTEETAYDVVGSALGQVVGGAVYVADTGNHRVRAVAANGVITTLISTNTNSVAALTAEAASRDRPAVLTRNFCM